MAEIAGDVDHRHPATTEFADDFVAVLERQAEGFVHGGKLP
jgi:hypothetical protein